MAIDTIDTGYKINAGAYKNIDAWGTCKKVTVSGSKAQFVSTKTSAQWTSFYDHAPANLSVGACDVDPCAGVSVGDACTNGVLYGGEGFSGLGSYKYMTTPGNCTNSATPTCDGTTDTLTLAWADGSGGTPASNTYVTGAVSTTNGASNTTEIATNWTDTLAAKYCQNMTYPAGGYTDWYLPALDELSLVLHPIYAAGKGGLSGTCWSSTDTSAATAPWLWDFVFNRTRMYLKVNPQLVRCVRKYIW